MSNMEIPEGSFTKINVLGRGDCLFWAVTLAYLTPVRDNNDLFKERFKRLFRSNDQQEVLLVQGLIQNHNLFLSDVGHLPLFNDRILTRLVIEEFRGKVVHEMRSRRDELIESITIQDLLHSRNIDYVVNGRFQENFLSKFGAEINRYNINLNKLKPDIFDEAAANTIDDELNKILDQDKVKKFKFDAYLECMRKPGVWGGNHEIQVISRFLQCEIVTFSNQVRHSTGGGEYNDQIQLFNAGELHYNFGLVKAEVLIDAINNNEWNKVKGYLALGIDNIDYPDKEGQTAFDLVNQNGDADINQLLSNQGAKPASMLTDVDTSGSRSVDLVNRKNIDGVGAVEAPQDFELTELLIREMDPVAGSDASTSTQRKGDFESFQARFQSYIDQISSYLHSVGKPGFFSHFFMGSFSTLLDTEIAEKLNIKKIYFSFDTSLTLKVVVVKNGPIGSIQDAINNIGLFSISEGKLKRGHQFTSGELEGILRENIDKSKIKDVESEIQKIKDKIQDKAKSRLVKISKGKDGISVTMETKEVVDHPTATRHEFHEMEKGLWNNPEGDIAGLTSSRKAAVENYLKEILGKISEIHSTYENKNLLRYSQKAREAAHHGFVAGILNNFRYRYNLRVYLEQFAGRGYADIVLLARGYDRSLKSIPIIIEQKAATSEELKELEKLKKLKDSTEKKKKTEKLEKNSKTTPAAALEQAANYAKGFQPNVQRVLTTADDILCVGINFDYPSSISDIKSLSREVKVIPLFEDILRSIDEWSVEDIGKRRLKKQIKVNVERIYHTFPGTTEKGGNHYFSRFLLGQLLLLNEPLGASYKKYIFIYRDNIPTETRPKPVRSSKRLADKRTDKKESTNLDESHAVVSIVLIPEDTEKLVYVINTVEINRKREKENDVLNKVLPLDRLDREIGDRKIVEFDLDFDTRYKSNFKRYLTARAHKPASLEEYNNRNEAFQGTFSEVLYPTELKEIFDKALDSQRTPSSIDEYHELFKKIGKGIWPFRILIGKEAHFQGVLNGVFSYYSDLKLQESPETRALVLTEFQTGGGKRIDMLVHGVKFEDGGENAKEYAPIGLELKASRQGKGGSAKALLEEANTQINDEYKKGVTYKTLTDGDEVKFIGVVFDKAAKDGNSLVLLSKSKIDGFIPVKVVHSSTLVLPTVDKQDLSGCLGQSNRKKRSISRCLFSWDDIDKFNNVENVDKRNRGKIKIDNEKFLTYIKNSQDESKNAQLVDFIGEKITPSIEGNYKYLLNEVVQDGGYVNYDQNKRIKDLQNDVLQQDGSLAKNSKLKSRLINAAGRIQLIRGIHGATVSCKDGTATDCGLNLGGIAWSFASQPIENVLVKITPKLVGQAESVAGKVISGTLGKQTKFAIRVLGVKLGTTIARGTAGAFAGVFDLVDIGRSASNLVDCKNRENTDNPCGEKEIRDDIASISFSSVSFISGIGLAAASMPVVGVAVGFVIMVSQGFYSGVSNIIEYEKRYDTTHNENWSIFWRTLSLKAMSLDIQALEARHNIVNGVAQEAWKGLNNSSDSVVAYAMGFGDMLKEVSVRCTVGTGGSCPCGNNQFGVGFYKKCDEIRIVDEAGHAVIAMNEENNANTENLSRVLPNAIQNAEMICLPQATSEVYEKGIKKSDPTAVYRCENAMVIADKRKGMQNDKTIVYNLRNVNSGTIIGSNRLNNNFLIFKGNESVIGGNSTVNRFVFTNSDFSGKIVLGSNSTNVLDLSTVTEDIIRVNINYSHFSDISNIFYSGELQIKINDNEYLSSNINTSSSYHYIGRQNKIDQILCTGNSESLIGHNIIVNSGGGIDLREKDIIENCGKVIISPNTNIKGGEGNYTFYIETKGYKDRKLHSEIDVEGKGTVIFPEINLFSDCDEVTYSPDDNILSLKIKLGQDSQYILDIKNYIEQGSGKPNFILIDKNGSNIVPKIENFGSSTVVKVNSFELYAEYPLDNFDVVENRYREILNNNKDYKVFGVVRDKIQNQGNSTVPHMMFGSSGNDIINLDQGAVFAKGGNGSDIYVIDSCVGEREFIIDNDSDDKKLDILVLPEVPEGFLIQQGNLHLNCDDTHIQVKNYKHLMAMNRKGETFIPYDVQSIFDDSSVGNGELVHGELVPFIHATPTQSEFFLHKDFEYDHVVIDSRSENIEQYRDKDDLLLMRESEVPFIIKVEGYYDGSNRWENVNFILWDNGNFSYFDLPQEIDELISYQDKLKDDYKEVIEEYIIDFNRSVDIKHNQNDSLASIDQGKERIGVIILKGVHPDRVKVSSSGLDLVLRDIESNDTVNIKNWDSSESHRISTLEFDLGLEPLVIRRLDRFSLSDVVEIQTLINKASENYQNKVAVTENENDFKCFVSVNAFKTESPVYECLGFSQLQEQINFTENFCSLEQINQFKDKIPSRNKILQLLRNVQNDFALKGYEQNTVSKCSDLIFTEIVRLLVNKKNEHDYTQLHYVSAQMDNLYGLEFLINNGANINAIGIFGETPLHIAVIGGRLNVVEFLVDKGANINIRNNHGRTPLEEANRRSNSEIADFLMRKQNEYNLSLFDAVKDGDYDKVKGLLNKGADIEAKDSGGLTPLDLAGGPNRAEILKLVINKIVEQNKLDLVKSFLVRSAAETRYTNLSSRHSWTLLHYAAYNGNLAIFQVIFELPVEKRGNINHHAEAYGNWTPLYLAVYYDRNDVAKFLVNKCANIEARTYSNETALDLAIRRNNSEIANILSAKQSKCYMSSESAGYAHQAISDQGVAEPHYATRVSNNEKGMKTRLESVLDYLRWPAVSFALGASTVVGLVGGYFGYRNRLRGKANLAPVAAAIPLLTLGNTANAKSTEFRTKRTEQRLSESSESIQTTAIGGTNLGRSVITQLQEVTHYSPKAKVLPGTDKDQISHCLPGVQYGQEYIQGLTCHTENMRMMVFLKDSDIKLEKLEDSYSKQSCRSIEFNSRPSVYCEGDKTNIVYTPEIPQRPFEQLNEQLMLLQVVLHEGKKLYGWLQNLFSEKNNNAQIVKENPITTSVTDEQTTLWKEALDSTEKRLMDLTKVNTGETDLRWAWYILEDRKEEFEYLSQQLEINSQEANVFAENLQALMSELEVIESLHSITSEHNESNAAPKTDKVDISSHKSFEASSLLFGKKNTVFNGKNSGTTPWLKQGFFKAQSSVPTFISAPATNNSLSLSGKQSAV